MPDIPKDTTPEAFADAIALTDGFIAVLKRGDTVRAVRKQGEGEHAVAADIGEHQDVGFPDTTVPCICRVHDVVHVPARQGTNALPPGLDVPRRLEPRGRKGEDAMVRVLIERGLKPGKGPELLASLHGMRGDAVHASGYISGETLHDASDPNHYVTISTWHSLEEWSAWADCKSRQQVRERIAPLLANDERVTLLAHS